MPVPKPDRPNFLLICTDHWSDIFTRPGGHPVVMTPTIDQLARSGTRYTRAYSPCPSCIPARKSLMTGMRARTHGDRVYRDRVPLREEWMTLPQCFGEAGYQTYCVGKLHTWPQRDRIGFDEVILEDQGRHQYHDIEDGSCDDYELYLVEQGHTGREFASGMPTNDWVSQPWHLPDRCHQINWAAREMCRAIRRRDPRKPAFWYLSFSAPHPPMVPLQSYLDLYRDVDIDLPVVGSWAEDFDNHPHDLKGRTWTSALHGAPEHEIRQARLAFYATLTQIDHQIRTVIGYLQEAGLLKNTYILFTSDHGHMVGEHNMWTMTPFYEASARIPLILVPADDDERIGVGARDNRFAEFGDIMPTFLDLAGIPLPEQVDQLSLVGEETRDFIYGEHGEGQAAQRMVRQGRFKLMYFPVGNRSQLFDIETDPREENDLAEDARYAKELASLQALLLENIWGSDLNWVDGGKLVGLPGKEFKPGSVKQLSGQRGHRFP